MVESVTMYESEMSVMIEEMKWRWTIIEEMQEYSN